MIDLATRYGRYGHRRVGAPLRAEGFAVNHQRVERLWRREGLKVPRRRPKRRRRWLNGGSCVRPRPARPGHVWSDGVVTARTADGRAFRLLTVIDEPTRECRAIDVARRITADDVLDRLGESFIARGGPGHLRSDNGPGFTAAAVRRWLGGAGVKTRFIEPASPWEDGHVESFSGRLRDGLLNPELFDTLLEAEVLVARGRRGYNTVRPHTALGSRPPAPEVILARPPGAAETIRSDDGP